MRTWGSVHAQPHHADPAEIDGDMTPADIVAPRTVVIPQGGPLSDRHRQRSARPPHPPPEAVSLRPATAADAPALLALAGSQRVLQPGHGPIEVIVPTVEDIIVGWIAVLRYDTWSYIADLFVAPACRRRGIASLLIAQVIETAQVEHRAQIRLHVAATNTGARQLYTRAGFTPHRAGYWVRPVASVSSADTSHHLGGIG